MKHLKSSLTNLKPLTKDIFVVEHRPAENGRGVVVLITKGGSIDVLPKGSNAKANIHAGIGGAASMCPDGRMIFTDANTNGVFFLSSVGEVEEIIPGTNSSDSGNKIYYADFSISPVQPQLILALREAHNAQDEVVDTIAIIDTATRTSRVVVEGADFYSHPRFSPDGKNICWTQWSHPDMPWTGSQLYVADWVDGRAINRFLVAGISLKSAVCQPRWSLDGMLWFVDEPYGIWQLHRYNLTSRTVEYMQIEGYEEVEMGKAEWSPGKSVSPPFLLERN